MKKTQELNTSKYKSGSVEKVCDGKCCILDPPKSRHRVIVDSYSTTINARRNVIAPQQQMPYVHGWIMIEWAMIRVCRLACMSATVPRSVAPRRDCRTAWPSPTPSCHPVRRHTHAYMIQKIINILEHARRKRVNVLIVMRSHPSSQPKTERPHTNSTRNRAHLTKTHTNELTNATLIGKTCNMRRVGQFQKETHTRIRGFQSQKRETN